MPDVLLSICLKFFHMAHPRGQAHHWRDAHRAALGTGAAPCNEESSRSVMKPPPESPPMITFPGLTPLASNHLYTARPSESISLEGVSGIIGNRDR